MIKASRNETAGFSLFMGFYKLDDGIVERYIILCNYKTYKSLRKESKMVQTKKQH